MKTTDWIVTTADLQADPAIILKHAKERPLIVTEAGRPSAYLLSVELFDAMVERLTELYSNQIEKPSFWLDVAKPIAPAQVRRTAIKNSVFGSARSIEENELATNIAQAEEQFASGQFLSLQDAVSVLEAKWQRDEATS